MTQPHACGHTRSGRRITAEEVDALAAEAEAEAGYDVGELIGRRGGRGRPPLGSVPSVVESVRLDPELQPELIERASADGSTTAEVMRQAVRRFLRAS